MTPHLPTSSKPASGTALCGSTRRPPSPHQSVPITGPSAAPLADSHPPPLIPSSSFCCDCFSLSNGHSSQLTNSMVSTSVLACCSGTRRPGHLLELTAEPVGWSVCCSLAAWKLPGSPGEFLPAICSTLSPCPVSQLHFPAPPCLSVAFQFNESSPENLFCRGGRRGQNMAQ